MSHTVSPDIHRMVADAITAIQAGDRARGRTLLAQVLRLDPRHESAWLWMASLVETPERQRECLERALAINPTNETAQRALRGLSGPPPSPEMAIPDQASPPFTEAQTATPPGEPAQDPARQCPQCGAPIGMFDRVCGLCQSPLPLPSNPKRASLTRSEQLHLTGQGLQRPGLSRLFNTSTNIGIVVTGIALAVTLWTILQYRWQVEAEGAVPALVVGMSLLSLFIPLLFLVPGIVAIIHGVRGYQFAQSWRKAEAVAEAPILDVWQDEGFEYEPYMVAWELEVNRHGTPVRYRQAQRISEEMYYRLQILEKVRVRYLPERPDVSALDEEWMASIKSA
jgi:hypothetical protein